MFVKPPLGNLISGNAGNGILIDNASADNVLNGNYVGTTASGSAALGNQLDGIAIVGSNGNQIVGGTATEDPFVYYNVVSGNDGNGLRISDSNNTVVQENFFGIGADNASIVANTGNGILINGTSSNTLVGGQIPLGNVTSGNGQNGIEVADTASGFDSFNTFSGLFAFGSAAPNGNDGLLITSTGGGQTVETSVFSGNANNGIEIGGDASGVTVDPVIAGLTTDGTDPLPNGGDGLLIDGTAHDNTIGGYQLSIIPRNLFSSNDGFGVAVDGNAYDNSVFNSYIGLDVKGIAAESNGQGGIFVGGSAHGNVFGGDVRVEGKPIADLISGNQGNGVTLEDSTTQTTLTNDIIGSGANGAAIDNAGVAIATNGGVGNILGNNSISTGAPEDIAASPGDTISATSGAVTLLGAQTAQTTFVLAGNHNSVTGGAGSIHGQASGDNNTLVGGQAISLYTVSGANNLIVAGQGGVTGADLSQTTGAETATTNPLGKSGIMVSDLGSGADTVVGGGGASTVTAGSGNDVFGFVAGHAGGTEEIIGFKSSDNIAFSGYGYTAATPPQETLTNAGDMITLTDGTEILFAGLEHKLFSM